MKLLRMVCLLTLAFSSMNCARAEHAVDADTINRIADEGYNHGQVVDLAAHLDDQIGGRMTNSPAMRSAEKWTQDMFRSWGLKDVHPEAFDFGRGWWIESAQSRMVAPRILELRSIPIAWTPATNGALTAPVIVAPIRHARDLDAWKGKVAGKIVLISYPDPPKDETAPAFKRLDEGELGKLNAFHQPQYDPDSEKDMADRFFTLRKGVDDFMAAEGALALVRMSRSDDGLVHGEGYFHQTNDTLKLPEVEMAAEDYRRLARLAKVGEVKLEIDNRVHFEDGDRNGYNIIADIPGKDAKAGYVMAGAHLDSWVAGDGAADNGAGAVVVMEAARILSRLGVHPKRSIRFALWAGEEQGLIGSSAYVAKHLATRPLPTDKEIAAMPAYFWNTYPITPQPGFNDLAAYFNLDNGSGKIRGIYAEGNFAAMPILRNWLAPFDSLGANKVVAQTTGSTDHVMMTRLGLPAFQFIQDPLDYESKVHHTNLDTFDHLRTEDLRQAAVILATILLDAAESDAPLPHNVLPTQPSPTDPFHYKDPDKN
jgi:hypothetical protein